MGISSCVEAHRLTRKGGEAAANQCGLTLDPAFFRAQLVAQHSTAQHSTAQLAIK